MVIAHHQAWIYSVCIEDLALLLVWCARWDIHMSQESSVYLQAMGVDPKTINVAWVTQGLWHRHPLSPPKKRIL